MKLLEGVLRVISKSSRKRRTVINARELLEELIAQGIDPKDLEPKSYEEEMKYYRTIGDKEWKRFFTTRVLISPFFYNSLLVVIST